MKKKTLSVSEFKAKSLELFERVSKTGESYVITKRGKPIAQVIPLEAPSKKLRLGALADLVIHIGDVESPIDEKWEAAEGEGEAFE